MNNFRVFDNETQEYLNPGKCWVSGDGTIVILGAPYSPSKFSTQTRFLIEDQTGWQDRHGYDLYVGDALYTPESHRFMGERFALVRDENGVLVLESPEEKIVATASIFNHFTKVGTVHDNLTKQVAA